MGRYSLLAVFAVLAATGCNFPRPDTPLAQAAAEGRSDEVRRLLEEGAQVDERDRTGFTALTWAARHGEIEAVRLLLAAGANPDLRDGYVNGWSPLMHALHKGRTAVVVALLAAGADPNLAGNGGFTPLLMAAGYGNAEAVAALLEAKADPRTEAGGETPLTAAVGGSWDIDNAWSGCEAHTATVRAILAAAPGLRLPENREGSAALAAARRKGCEEILRLVGEAG
jgi:ankyrin repeat protein